jgi:hypothetical protein
MGGEVPAGRVPYQPARHRLDGWKGSLPAGEVCTSTAGRKSFQSTRYLYLVDQKETLPAGLGYALGYPDIRRDFGGKRASASSGGYPPADSGYPRRIIPTHL